MGSKVKMSGSNDTLKIFNEHSSTVLKDLLVDFEHTILLTASNDSLTIVGYGENNICIVPALNPDKAELFNFENRVVTCDCQPNEIVVLLVFNKVIHISYKDGKWSHGKEQYLDLYDASIIAIHAAFDGLVVCAREKCIITIHHALGGKELKQIARLDSLKPPDSIFLCMLPSSETKTPSWLIGTEDGHVYQLAMKGSHLKLLCDIQQPVASILQVSDLVTIVGKYGKISQISTNSACSMLTTFAPTPVVRCSSFGTHLLIQAGDQLYSADLKTVEGDRKCDGIETKYCRVKFIRAFHVWKNEKYMVLTEDGVLYQVDLPLVDGETSIHGGREVKSVLREIQRCTDRTKELNEVNERTRKDIEELSTALQMLGSTHSDSFPTAIRSFSSLDSERLRMSVTNNSSWIFPSSHWSFQIRVGESCTSFHFAGTWEKGKTLELEERFVLPDTISDSIQVQLTLLFRTADLIRPSEPQPMCAFPISQVTLNVLDFLEPAVPRNPAGSKSYSDIMGFNRKTTDPPWSFLLARSWHRDFQQLLSTHPPPAEVTLRCGTIPVRMCLKEDKNETTKLWILQIDTPDPNLLQLLRSELFHLIQSQRPLDKSDIVRVPNHALAHLLNLRVRLNYIQSLSSWDETDIEPLREEIRLLVAKQLPIL